VLDRPTLLLSFDCEGRWGMADLPENPLLSLINRRSLLATYERLLGILDELELPATFAVVGAFLGDRDEFESNRGRLDDSKEHATWMFHIDRSLASDDDGWFLPQLRGLLDARPHHELASHGYSHLPFNSPGVTDNGRRLELSASVTSAQGRPMTTIVFPRNAVVGVELLAEFGIQGYRDAALTARRGKLGRAARILDELAGRPHSQRHAAAASPVAIPSGRLLHWRRGVRRVVPVARTVSHWSAVADHALTHSGVAHLWLHPHNLITGHRQFVTLERSLRAVAERRRDGLVVMTQSDYVRAVKGTGALP
jgi:peptidoglycan/xylan/chitin deacetylase (PgdA/CDA1 family)